MPKSRNKRSLRITKLREPIYSPEIKPYSVGVIKKPKKKGKVVQSYLNYTGKWTTRLLRKEGPKAHQKGE